MPEMELERTGSDIPVAFLPPGVGISDRVVEIFVQVAKADAGCSICSRVCPKGASRVVLKIRMPDVINDMGNYVSPPRRTQRYHFHPACFTKPMGSEIKRGAYDCFDCGALPPMTTDPYNGKTKPDFDALMGLGWTRAFTTSRFSSMPLCPTCAKKPRWRKCDNCDVRFPQWMVVRGEYERKRGKNRMTWEPIDEPSIDEGDWCTYCVARYGVKTQEHLAQSAEEFEELRRRIMEEGVFDG